MSSAWRLQQAVFALRTGAHRLAEEDPDTIISVPDDLPEELAYVHAAMVAVAQQAREATALGEMARKMAAETADRAKRFERRADQLRGVLYAAMDVLEEKKIESAGVTISMRAGQPAVVVTDEAAIPDIYWRVKREVDKAALRDALKTGAAIDGAVLSNSLPSIQIRAS